MTWNRTILLAAVWMVPVCAQSRVDAAFEKFWAADSPQAAARRVDDLVKSGVTFEQAWQKLKQGRAYTAKKTGVMQLQNHTEDGVEHFFAVTVPDSYDPAKKYQVRFQLHGGVGGRENNQPKGDGTVGTLVGADQFYVVPYAWAEQPWWSDDQVLNLNAIVDTLKRRYNIDENRVVVSGVSDGGTGTYFIAMRDTTPFASFLPLNGYIMVLSNSEIDDGKIFPGNLRNKPLFVVNGGKDRLYPTRVTEPFTKFFQENGVEIDYHPQPNGEHNTRWWREVKGPFEAFVAAHPRDPYPDKVTWETADAAHGRAHWLVIDQIGTAPGEAAEMDNINVIQGSGYFEQEAEGPMFEHPKPTGRVDLMKKGNTVEAKTKGVTAFTLLLSPDDFDFSQPVRVVANGREVFNGRVKKSVATLLKWAAKDNDRTMLFGAELPVSLKR